MHDNVWLYDDCTFRMMIVLSSYFLYIAEEVWLFVVFLDWFLYLSVKCLLLWVYYLFAFINNQVGLLVLLLLIMVKGR